MASRVRSRALIALLVSAVAITAASGTAQSAPRGSWNPLVKLPGDHLDSHDRQLLGEARQAHRANTIVLLVAQPGQTDELARQVKALGGIVTNTAARIGYVRATVPTSAVEKVAKIKDLRAMDLNETFQLPPSEPTSAPTLRAEVAQAGPDKNTPAANPYLPTDDTDSVRFKKQNPTWDGRGVTIGVVDSGVSLDNPALQITSTGQRKIVDWVTGTDPAADGDGTWRPMQTAVTGPSFVQAGSTWRSPAGSFRFNTFSESITAQDQLGGDVNRDGDTTDQFGILYDPVSHDIRVDSDQDHDFTNNPVMRPYREHDDVGHFGTDKPSTPQRDQVPFVVEYREDVDLAPLGETGTADFVNIGITEDEHGSHVSGIAAGNDMFDNPNYDGQAPGAQIVSSRACSWGGGCTAAALVDGVIDLVLNRGVDVVNISIGGLPALNDGDNARALIYNLLIDAVNVQFFISAGNSGPGVNTVGDPGVASSAVSVGASVSRETWLSNYGSVTSAKMSMFPFSSNGPREDGGFKPNLTAPGAAISTIDAWLPGAPVREAGYSLPPGYAMLQGTSMAAPEATGAAALLLSAAKASGLTVTSPQLRQALYSSAQFLKDIPAAAQGNGLIDVRDAWKFLRTNAAARYYTSKAPVCTIYSGFLADPNQGEGIFNRCSIGDGGQAAGQSRSYAVTLTRFDGPVGSVVHNLRWLGNDGTFSAPAQVTLLKGAPVTVTVTARPSKVGAHSAILQVDDPATPAIDYQTLNTVVAATPLEGPAFRFTASDKQERNATRSYFVDVPAGAAALQVDLSGLSAGSQVRWIAIPPSGVPVENTSSPFCYPNYNDPANPNACPPLSRSYADPAPGVWELEVEARRTTPLAKNPFTLTARLFGVTLSPPTVSVPTATVGTPVPVEWQAHNDFGPVTVHGSDSPLGSASARRPTIAEGAQQVYSVQVPAGSDEFQASIGHPSDPGADLDLYVFRNGTLVAQSADGDAEESVVLDHPAAGLYQMLVDGYAVPTGSTDYDYLDAYLASGLGTLSVSSAPAALIQGQTATIAGSVTAAAVPPAGRQLFGRLNVVNDQGTVVGRATVLVGSVH